MRAANDELRRVVAERGGAAVDIEAVDEAKPYILMVNEVAMLCRVFVRARSCKELMAPGPLNAHSVRDVIPYVCRMLR